MIDIFGPKNATKGLVLLRNVSRDLLVEAPIEETIALETQTSRDMSSVIDLLLQSVPLQAMSFILDSPELLLPINASFKRVDPPERFS